MHQNDKINNMIKELDEIMRSEKIYLSINDGGEASMLLSQSFIDGMSLMYKKVCTKLVDLKSEMIEPKAHIAEPPKELADFKVEVLKDMRQTIRSNFQDILLQMQSTKDKENLQQKLMLLDKKLVNQISNIRIESPNSIDQSQSFNYSPFTDNTYMTIKNQHGSVINKAMQQGLI